MKKAFLLAVILYGIVLVTSVACAQQLTSWEERVYYDLVEKVHFMSKDVKSDSVRREITNKYSISNTKLDDIISKAVEREPTGREWNIFDALWEKIDALPKGRSRAEFERAYGEVANKYDISLVDLYEIDFRCLEWEFSHF